MAETAGAQEAGAIEHGRELVAALAAYFQARLRLAAIEGKDALIHYAIVLALGLGALGVVVFGYLFLCIGLIVWLARLLQTHVEWVIIGFALLHFAVAFACLLIAKSRLVAPMFSATISESKKDQQWLTDPKQN